MANSEPTSSDAVAAFEAAAEAITASCPEVVEAIGRTAAGATAAEAKQRVRLAAGKIVQALTEVSAAVISPQQAETPAADQAEAAPTKPVTPGMIPPRRSVAQTAAPDRAESQEQVEEVSLSEQEVDERLTAYFARIAGGRIGIPGIIRDIVGESRVDSETYRYIWSRVEREPSALRIGRSRFLLGPGQEWINEHFGYQLPLWDLANPPKDDRPVGRAPSESQEAAAEKPVDEVVTNDEAVASADETSGEEYAEDDESDEDSETISDEELIGMVARFMGRRPYFTADELRQHLLKNDAVSPGEVAGNKIHAFIEEFMMYVDEYYFDKGDDVVWTDSSTDPDAIRQAMGGKTPKVKTYMLGFKPRPMAQPSEAPAAEDVIAPEAAAKTTVTETTEPEAVVPAAGAETKGQHERAVTLEQTQIVVDAVAQVGAEITRDSLLEILCDPEEFNMPREQALEWINASVADGFLFRKRVEGKKGLALDPPEKRPEEMIVDTDNIEYVEHQVEKYVKVVEAVLDYFDTIEFGEGRAYNKLWRAVADRLRPHVSFEEFKNKVRRMEDDGYVAIPANQRLHTRSPHTKARRGNKVRLMDPSLAAEWKDRKSRTRILTQAMDRELNRLIR